MPPHHSRPRYHDESSDGYSGLFVTAVGVLGAATGAGAAYWGARAHLTSEIKQPSPELFAPIRLADVKTATEEELARIQARLSALYARESRAYQTLASYFSFPDAAVSAPANVFEAAPAPAP